MLSFFKSNNPTVVIIYLLYLALFRVCYILFPANFEFVIDHNEPLSQLLFAFLKDLPVNTGVLSLTLSGILCFVQAIYVNYIVNENKLIARKNYTAGLFFILFSSFFKESLFLTPSSIALTFLIICTGNIFSLIKKDKPYTSIFDAGFLIALGVFFYSPCILYIVLVYIGMSIMRPFVYREWLMALVGFLSPFLILFTFYFWNDSTSRLWHDLINAHPVESLKAISINSIERILILALFLIMMTLFAFLPSALYSGLIQVRKFSSFLVLLVLFTVGSFFLQINMNLSHLVLLGLPLSMISAIVLVQIKSKVIPEVFHLILILLALAGQFLPLLNIL